jgi:tRNA A-37 threonylcarbamoyl transferase component Bud32
VKGRITATEKSRLIEVAESAVPRDQISSIFAYGPRIAGYDRREPGSELVVVTKNLKQRAAVRDESVPKGSLPLVIGEAALLEEAKKPSHDESVVNRFLNIYEPLLNAGLLKSTEIEYKKRVIAERLFEVQTNYGDLSSNLIIPYEYLLFEKLHRRVLAHPEEISGVARTYSCARGRENLEFTLKGFRAAADFLAAQGIMEKTGDSVRIFRGKKREMALSSLLKMFPLDTAGAAKHAWHGLANRAGYEFKTKPFSKQTTSRRVKSNVKLDRPNRLLRLEEGVVFDDGSKLVEDLARVSGFPKKYRFKEKKKGDFINSSSELEIWDGERRVKYILKHFPEVKSSKWAILNLWSLASKRFNMSSLSRLDRELAAASRLRKLGIKTHRIIGVVLDGKTLVTEYVNGVPLDKHVEEITTGKSTDTLAIEQYGRVLGRLHKAGMVYGDTKPQNALVVEDGIELLDLEQAVENGDPSWDLAEFLYYSAKLSKDNDGMRLVADAFLKGYRRENTGRAIEEAENRRYLAPFIMFLTPEKIGVVRDALKRYE